jgi:hypothetical protein
MAANEFAVTIVLTLAARTEIIFCYLNTFSKYGGLDEFKVYWQRLIIHIVGDGNWVVSLGGKLRDLAPVAS